MTVSLTLHLPGDLPPLPRTGLLRQMARAMGHMAQWRLLLAWWLALAVPTLLVALPVWQGLARQLDHSLLGPTLAQGMALPLLAEALAGLFPSQAVVGLGTLGVAGLAWTLLVSPWLVAMAGAAARRSAPLAWNELLRTGLADYARMARLLVWSLCLLGLALGLGAALMHAAELRAGQQVLEADTVWTNRLAEGVTALLVLLAQVSVEQARARLVLQPRLRSVVLAWWRALPQLWRGRGLWLFLALSLGAGLALAGLTGLRLALAAPGVGHAVGAVLLGQAGLLALVWLRCVRLQALVDEGRQPGR
ncbi:hypothetical protein KGA65_03110 [Ideonella sp. B7]|nr:hypothetical protein [Ideonella benzenivorans]